MVDFLEYSDITAEIKGCMIPGKIKMTDQAIIFKNSKTGKVEQFPGSEIDIVNFQNFVGNWGLRIFLKNGALHRFVGFKEGEKEKIAKFFTASYKKETLEKELSLKGWNWGTAKFNGSVLGFDIGEKTVFEIPLNHVSQCVTGKNEVTLEFHQNDDAPVSLMEMRFYIPASELAGDVDPVDAFQKQVMKKASVISVSGDAIAIFREIHCLTPRGRYDIKIFQTFFQLHGKTFDYKIPMSTVLRLFLLPHKDIRQMFFVISLDPPIKQGQTRYHFLVLLFGADERTSIELPFTEEELKEKYENKLEKELEGPTYEVLGKVMKNILNRKLTGPGNFIGHSGTPAVGCSFKAAAGYLYPLERGFIYVHKPPLHIRFEEIASVNFARGGGSTRSFDFEIELKSGTVHTFSSIEKEEYGKLFDFITAKKLHVKNRGQKDKTNYKDDFGDSDTEAAPDAYLERVKAEAQERGADESSDGSSTDEDFSPGRQAESDVAEEFDSNPSTTSDEESGSDKEKKEKKPKKEKKEKKAKTVSEKPRKTTKKKKERDGPKRPSSAYFLWLNEHREKIKSENPGIKVTEIAKKGGEMWKQLKDKSEWEKKAAKAKEEYEVALKAWKAEGGGSSSSKDKESKKSEKDSKKTTTTSPKISGSFKSKEYISDDDSSSSEDEKKSGKKRKASDSEEDAKKKKSKAKPKSDDDDEEEEDSEEDAKKKTSKAKQKSEDSDDGKKKKSKSKKKSDDEDEEEEVESTPASSEVSDSD
ncbi:hypothetical protein PPYR_11658 [Photinus pyralis]|uniref:FACT complex subunit SSRP1 n=1 Tax=Photinus pyralis TaxID=7054 RepID=A0A5N4AC03_PHOPY|nr:FACT complex subunit Ssrp1 [Photinus pyralis]KAB0794819.1 hypothetical protein PPYR_11658 [Photinus pyralis]